MAYYRRVIWFSRMDSYNREIAPLNRIGLAPWNRGPWITCRTKKTNIWFEVLLHSCCISVIMLIDLYSIFIIKCNEGDILFLNLTSDRVILLPLSLIRGEGVEYTPVNS